MSTTDWVASTPCPGVVVHQPARGFRYSAEAFWLVGFGLQGGIPRTALDLGTGSGVMAMMLAAQGVDVLGVDSAPQWQEGWEQTLSRSRCQGRCRLQLQDVHRLNLSERFDLVVSNPPFFKKGSGPTPQDPWKSAARFESTATIARFCAVGCAHLSERGRLVLVIPENRVRDAVNGIPAGFGLSRYIRVGKRRALLEIRSGVSTEAEPVLVDDRSVDVVRWYALAQGT